MDVTWQKGKGYQMTGSPLPANGIRVEPKTLHNRFITGMFCHMTKVREMLRMFLY